MVGICQNYNYKLAQFLISQFLTQFFISRYLTMSFEKNEISPTHTVVGRPAEFFPPTVQQPGYGIVQYPTHQPIQQQGHVQQPIQQPGYGPPPVQQVFVAPPQKLGTHSCVAICPHCHHQVILTSRINYSNLSCVCLAFD